MAVGTGLTSPDLYVAQGAPLGKAGITPTIPEIRQRSAVSAYDVQSLELGRVVWKMYAKSAPQANT
jgi:hypothetical protein